mmetsp:Transcript_14204/g.53816  ORF Transcript_14204/g.53816 Transcript_14204/m.53816 type:complete len:285 (-) Transcript_14204:647-1501(-)
MALVQVRSRPTERGGARPAATWPEGAGSAAAADPDGSTSTPQRLTVAGLARLRSGASSSTLPPGGRRMRSPEAAVRHLLSSSRELRLSAHPGSTVPSSTSHTEPAPASASLPPSPPPPSSPPSESVAASEAAWSAMASRHEATAPATNSFPGPAQNPCSSSAPSALGWMDHVRAPTAEATTPHAVVLPAAAGPSTATQCLQHSSLHSVSARCASGESLAGADAATTSSSSSSSSSSRSASAPLAPFAAARAAASAPARASGALAEAAASGRRPSSTSGLASITA